MIFFFFFFYNASARDESNTISELQWLEIADNHSIHKLFVAALKKSVDFFGMKIAIVFDSPVNDFPSCTLASDKGITSIGFVIFCFLNSIKKPFSTTK